MSIASEPDASGTVPLRLALTDRCDAADPAQRFYFDWDTVRSDFAPGLCVAPVRGVLVLKPCDESERSQLWVSRPRRANAPTEHIEAAEGENVSWTATAGGAVRLEPTRDDTVQEWGYVPVR
ncbi:hypothetical protein [Streptomyces griseosporeus]|uniref:hypothetical protein n=1 Tax=Streptomyces griseosporeus TaxID=1910 RepID=UPI0037BE025F